MRIPDLVRRGRPGSPGAHAAFRGTRFVLAGVCTAAVLSGCAAAPVLPPPPAAAATTIPSAVAPAVPSSVRIPAISVDSPLPPLGIAADGSAEVPTDYDLAGWFSGGGRPGSRGPTVLLGHVDSRSGPAVFYRLRELRPGDVVEVVVSGGVARYAVDRTEQVPKNAFPTFAVFGATPDDVLRLVTCAGEFDRGARSYEDNLVVHARRV